MTDGPYELSEALIRAGSAWLELVERLLTRRFGLSYAQFLVLDQIARSPGLRPGELARRLGRTKGDMTGVVGRLARAGLVRREPVAGDRRALALHVTERGNFVALALSELKGLAQSALGGLSSEERTLLLRSLARVEAGLRAALAPDRASRPAPASPGPPLLYDPRADPGVRLLAPRPRRRLRRRLGRPGSYGEPRP
ncbi:MAG: MarR family transcriptional regulator [Clostridia bacterium]|nr:MarR family transcriptional regulator [Clostridia bacterium]